MKNRLICLKHEGGDSLPHDYYYNFLIDGNESVGFSLGVRGDQISGIKGQYEMDKSFDPGEFFVFGFPLNSIRVGSKIQLRYHEEGHEKFYPTWTVAELFEENREWTVLTGGMASCP